MKGIAVDDLRVTRMKEPLNAKTLVDILRTESLSVEEIAVRFNVPIRKVTDTIEELSHKKTMLTIVDGKYSVKEAPIEGGRKVLDPDLWRGDTIRFGFTSDNHLCFPATTTITTSDGNKKICNIKIGDLVLTHKNRFRPVKRIIKHKYSGEFVRIFLRGYNFNSGGSDQYASVRCTPDHPFLVCRDGIDVWVPAQEIHDGDLVRVEGHKCSRCDNAIPPWLDVCKECDLYVNPRGVSKEKRHFEMHKGGSRHYREDIIPEMHEWEKRGFRCIPIDTCQPDFIAIKDNKITAVEVEAPVTNHRPSPIINKYAFTGTDRYYDDVKWILKDRRSHKRNCRYDYYEVNEFGFPCVKVQKIEKVGFANKKWSYENVYNLEVEEDNSYLAKRFVVHNCSHFERLDVLNLIYDICEGEGVKTVLNGGNWIDGEARFNKNEIHKVGLDRQINYAVEVYPYRKGIETWFVSGDDHEGWYNQREGINIGDYFQSKREQTGMFDLKHLGYVEADIDLNEGKFENGSWLRVMHAGGGSAYATSYAAQKIVESLQGGEKPSVLFIGHYHKLLYAYIRNVHTIQMGATQDQSIFMRKKKIEAHVGGGIVELRRDKFGSIVRCKVDFITAFDKKFYVGKDKYWKSK